MMDAKRRIAAVAVGGLVMVGGAAAYAARGGDGPIDQDTAVCGSATPYNQVDRISATDVDKVAKAVLADPLLARLTDVSKLRLLRSTDDPKAPGVYVMPKAMDSPALGRIAPVVSVRFPHEIPTGVQRFRVTEEAGAIDCKPPTEVWTQDVEIDMASLRGAYADQLVAQVDLDPVRVVHLTPNIIEPDTYRRVGERVYLVGGK